MANRMTLCKNNTCPKRCYCERFQRDKEPFDTELCFMHQDGSCNQFIHIDDPKAYGKNKKS